MIGGLQRHFLMVGGSRSRKTFTGVRATCARAIKAGHSRHLIARLRANAARASIALDTFPTVMRTCFPGVPYEEKERSYFELPNRSEIWVAGLDDKERVDKILGNEYVTIMLNECSQIPYGTRNTVMTRLAQNVAGLKQKSINDLNPVGKSHWTYRLFIQGVDPANPQRKLTDEERARLAHIFMNPKDNPTLDPDYLSELMNLPARQKARFYDGSYVDEIEGALWTLEVLELGRVTKGDVPDLQRIVVAVDPSGASSETDFGSDEIGIIVVGLGVDGDGYILADYSIKDAPAKWGRRAIQAYHDFNADLIIAEQNFGGEMVRFVIQSQDKNVPVEVITASRGKVVRAEPVSALYERKVDGVIKPKVHHVGSFAILEDQMLAFSTMGYTGEGSPDRTDALVWGVTKLLLPAKPGAAHVIEHMRREAVEQASAKIAAAAAGAKPAKEPGEHEVNKVYDLRHEAGRKHAAAEKKEEAPKPVKKQRTDKKYSSFSQAQEEATT